MLVVSAGVEHCTGLPPLCHVHARYALFLQMLVVAPEYIVEAHPCIWVRVHGVLEGSTAKQEWGKRGASAAWSTQGLGVRIVIFRASQMLPPGGSSLSHNNTLRARFGFCLTYSVAPPMWLPPPRRPLLSFPLPHVSSIVHPRGGVHGRFGMVNPISTSAHPTLTQATWRCPRRVDNVWLF